MNKLEVGMYVKTNKGIFQIRNKDVFIEDKKQYIGVNGRYTCIDIETIEKASHNIIDLIEVGDYVNGYKIVKIFKNQFNGEKVLISLQQQDGYDYSDNIKDYMCDDSIHIYNEYIKSIVTKEQFKSMEYRLGE